jgi:hypothetical protein
LKVRPNLSFQIFKHGNAIEMNPLAQSPLWRMKSVTRRETHAGDLVFLRPWFAERGRPSPRV